MPRRKGPRNGGKEKRCEEGQLLQFVFEEYNFKSVTGEFKFPGPPRMYCASQLELRGPTSLHLGTSMFYCMGSYLLDDKPLQSSCSSPSLSYPRKDLINWRSALYQSSTRALGQHRMTWITFLRPPYVLDHIIAPAFQRLA